MSLRDEKILSLLGTNIDKLSDEELKNSVRKFLKVKFMGFALAFMREINSQET